MLRVGTRADDFSMSVFFELKHLVIVDPSFSELQTAILPALVKQILHKNRQKTD